MLTKILAVVGIATVLSGCNSKQNTSKTQTSRNGLTIGTAFSPDPPKQGPQTITVTVKDASGAAVKGARVKISSSMPSMSMAGPSLSAQDNGDGTYTGHVNLNYATRWSFQISAAANNKTVVSEVNQDVK